MPLTKRSVLQSLKCPCCGRTIGVPATEEIVCPACGRHYPSLGQIPVLLPEAQAYLKSCRRELDRLDRQTERTIAVIEEHLRLPDLLPATKARCRATIEAVRAQASDIRAVLFPLIGGGDTIGADSEHSIPALLTYIHYLYRDWGWQPDENDENECAFRLLASVRNGRRLGRTLVLGAGACRLAYDLHLQDPHADTVVLDIDPLLFAVAHEVIRGGVLTVHEVNAEIHELSGVVKEWALRAHHGSLSPDRFHFMLADGLEPPFVPESFDTILTPWFIDLVPQDLRNFISELHRLLKPGGQWLNLGPLHYKPEVPLSRRYSREEIFDLAVLAGFRVDRWQTQTVPYLVSRLNGRGKLEWVLAFSATRLEGSSARESDRTSPAWLLFRHIPVPVFPEQSTASFADPAEQIVASAIDGKNTLEDIAVILKLTAGETGLTMDQLREIVRRCLIEIHPGAKANND